MKVPILFIIFNRPEIAFESFKKIREYKPDDLYIAADGPRSSREEDFPLCEQTRRLILESIDWDCNVHKLFRDSNIGVDKGVYEAINWMFRTEKWGVIIEDDCIISIDFFTLCEDAFLRYENDNNIVHIGANNTFSKCTSSNICDFTYFPKSWGWGTWSQKWRMIMDVEMKNYPKYNIWRLIPNLGLFQTLMMWRYWKITYKNRASLKTWDSIWQFNVMTKELLCILPRVNLVINNGIGTSDGSHYSKGDKNFYNGIKIGHLNFPILWPSNIKVNKVVQFQQNFSFFKLRIWGLSQKIKKKCHVWICKENKKGY